MNLRKLGAAVAVSALILMSIGGGSIAANAAPAPPTIYQTFADPWFTSSTQPEINGTTVTDNVLIHVESSLNGVNFVPYCTVSNSPPGTTWGCPVNTGNPLPIGVNYIQAIGEDSGGILSAASYPPIAIHVVNAPTITSPADDLYTNDYMPSFAGTSDGSYFFVSSPEVGTLCEQGTVVNMTWNCETLLHLADGDYTYRVATRFGSDDTDIYSEQRTIHIDTTVPAAPTIFPPSNPVNSSPAPSISGAGEENASVEVLVDGQAGLCPASTVLSGTWFCAIGTTLSAGSYNLTATQTDLAGNLSPLSTSQTLVIQDNTPPDPPVVTSPIGTVDPVMNAVITNNPLPTITGTGEPGATLNVTGNTCMIWPTIVDAGGNWSCLLTTPLTPDGDYTVPFSLTDTAGNTSANASPYIRFTVDTTAPAAPTVDPMPGTVNSSPAPSIFGTAEEGASVEVLVDGAPVSCPNAIGNIYGDWSCTVGTTLSAGNHTVTAIQTDLAGNPSLESTGQTLVITDNTPPLPPVISTPSVSVTTYTNNPDLVVTGTGEPLADIAVYVDGTLQACDAGNYVQADSSWECQMDPSLTEGAHTIVFQQVDFATNSSADSSPLHVILDTVAPSDPTVTSPAGTMIAGVRHVTTTDRTPVITGSAEDGATVQIFRDGSYPVPCTVDPLLAGPSGYSCQVASPLPYGTHNYSFIQIDRAGNPSGTAAILLRLTVSTPLPPHHHRHRRRQRQRLRLRQPQPQPQPQRQRQPKHRGR